MAFTSVGDHALLSMTMIIKQLYSRRAKHNSNSTDELKALDPKSTVIGIKMNSRIIKLVNRSLRM